MRQIRVTYHREDGSWWADSDEIAGFTAAAGTLAKLRELTAEAANFYLDEPVALDEYLDSGARLDAPWRAFFSGLPSAIVDNKAPQATVQAGTRVLVGAAVYA
ncbi:MAG: DUF1902 domain-containing protein [Microbacteriaceae bacterium]|nr:DUF1902 domain-containing protein [Microbacteriaceae bacterium]